MLVSAMVCNDKLFEGTFHTRINGGQPVSSDEFFRGIHKVLLLQNQTTLKLELLCISIFEAIESLPSYQINTCNDKR